MIVEVGGDLAGITINDVWIDAGTIGRELWDEHHHDFIDEYDAMYTVRRPRKMVTRTLQRRLLREAGMCIVGDFCRIPEHKVTIGDYQSTAMQFEEETLYMRWRRRYRSASPHPLDYDIRSFNARFV